MSCSCCHPKEPVTQKVQQTLAQCRKAGMRKTLALEKLLSVLFEKALPQTLHELCDSLEGICDRATIFRLLQRLTEHGLARRLGTHERSTRFMLLDPSCHHDFIMCTECGHLEVLEIACPAAYLEQEIEKEKGFLHLTHDLTFYGLCPTCQKAKVSD